MSTQPKSFLTPEEYLEIERKAEFKSEYYAGEMYSMAGASRVHNIVVSNVHGHLFIQLRGRPCELYSSDMRVQLAEAYAYPDGTVVCGNATFVDTKLDTLLNPTLIVEVLSKSTEAYDRGLKFELYSGIDSLQQYLMISTGRRRMELFTRQPNQTWLLSSVSQPNDVIELQSIGCRLKVVDVYDKVEIPPIPRSSLRP
jgi:Uma2 family endonuclease